MQRPTDQLVFYLLDGAKITSEGSPINPIHIARYNMVQEQANTNWTDTRGQSVVTYCSTPDALPSARFRFTEWSTPAQDTYHFFGSDIGYNFPVAFVDNQFRGGMFLSCRPTLGITNSLFEKVSSFLSDANAAFDAAFQNNLFYGGTNWLEHLDIGTWRYRDNLFHNTGISLPYAVDADYNAYLTNAATLLSSSGSHEIVLTNASIDFQAGLLGNYYLPTNFNAAHQPRQHHG